MFGGALAAQVPPGTSWRKSRNWSEITAVNLPHSIRIKSRATLNSTSLAISLKGWSA
jgi:hypothetical protein